MHIHMFERHLTGQVRRHHDHARDPEEDDVKACDQYARGQIAFVVWCLLGPTQRGERHERGRKPGVEYIWIA